jgi:hypothetical protein
VSLRAASSLRDLTSLRGGTMRNFDFAIQHYSSTSQLQLHQPDELPPSGLQNLFSGFHLHNILRATLSGNTFSPAKLAARQSNGPIDLG